MVSEAVTQRKLDLIELGASLVGELRVRTPHAGRAPLVRRDAAG
jgi:hypothetical protein